jgi:uncharacterized SAM-binding protein YcdF (DUF218 family)
MTKARCDAAFKYATNGFGLDGNYLFVLTAGFTPDNPTKPTSDAPVSLAQEMHDYLIECGVPSDKIFAEPLTWGTTGESRAAKNAIEKYGITNLVVVSDYDHLWRIIFTWARFKKASWKICFPYPMERMNWHDRKREFAAYIDTAIDLIFGWSFIRFLQMLPVDSPLKRLITPFGF